MEREPRKRTQAAKRVIKARRHEKRALEIRSAMDRAQRDIDRGEETAAEAYALRKQLRRKASPGEARNMRIDAQLAEIAVVMRPIRSHRGRVKFGGYPPEQETALATVSKSLQYEAHALRRMKR